jgi:hypothetical protein
MEKSHVIHVESGNTLGNTPSLSLISYNWQRQLFLAHFSSSNSQRKVWKHGGKMSPAVSDILWAYPPGVYILVQKIYLFPPPFQK